MRSMGGQCYAYSNAEWRCGLCSWLHPERRIRTGKDANRSRAPSRFFLWNIVEDHLIAVRAGIERIFHLVDSESALVGIVAGRRDHREVVVVVWKALVLVRRLPGPNIGKLAVAGAPWLDIVRQILE